MFSFINIYISIQRQRVSVLGWLDIKKRIRLGVYVAVN